MITITDSERGSRIGTLTSSEVIKLHELLTSDPIICAMTEPVSPSGVKNFNLLESAISRQYSGFGTYNRFNTIFSNCATLVFGIACNHAFHNGNKRTALLSMLMHLYKNGYVLTTTISNEIIYEFLRSIASHDLKTFADCREYRNIYNSIYRNLKKPDDDIDLKFIELWIKKHVESINQSERALRWKTVIDKLKSIELKVEIDSHHNKIVIIREKKGFFSRILGIGANSLVKSYPYDPSSACEKHLIREIRKDFSLTKSNGFDDFSFYVDESAFIESEIFLFKRAIYKLSKN